MKKYGQGLILIGLLIVVVLLVSASLRPTLRISEAQTLEPLANLPLIIKSDTLPPPTVPPPPPGLIYVDHNSVALFEQIPTQYLNAAAGMDMVFVDRSVGGNISDGLDCLSQPWADAPNHCKRYEHPIPEYSVDPSEVFWTGTYDRSNWDYFFWPTNDPNVPPAIQLNCSAPADLWPGKVECYLEYANANLNNYHVLSYQFSYLSVDDDSNIADPATGYFANTPGYDVHEQAAFEDQHPDKAFIYWTTSLARTIGTQVSDDFNSQMRQYAINNEEILFDVADILSHDPDGNPCYDANGNGHLAICPHYTTEPLGGHLGSVSAGKIRVAKAFWVLMAQIAGWDPN